MSQLTQHFSLEEMTTTSQTGPDGRLLYNVPGELATIYLRILCETLLEPIRALWCRPVLVSSGYRSLSVELQVSGKDFGQHRKGQAADIVPVGDLSLDEAYRLIWASALPYDQLLLERSGESRWIHVSCAPTLAQPRRQALYSENNGITWASYQPPLGGTA